MSAPRWIASISLPGTAPRNLLRVEPGFFNRFADGDQRPVPPVPQVACVDERKGPAGLAPGQRRRIARKVGAACQDAALFAELAAVVVALAFADDVKLIAFEYHPPDQAAVGEPVEPERGRETEPAQRIVLVADVAGHRQAGPLFQVERHCQGRHDGAGVDPDRVGLEIADERVELRRPPSAEPGDEPVVQPLEPGPVVPPEEVDQPRLPRRAVGVFPRGGGVGRGAAHDLFADAAPCERALRRRFRADLEKPHDVRRRVGGRQGQVKVNLSDLQVRDTAENRAVRGTETAPVRPVAGGDD